MYIYNTTYLVSKAKWTEWRAWVIDTHIPEMERFGFCKPQIAKVLTADESNEFSISVQFCIEDREQLIRWQETELGVVRKALHRLFATDVLAFDTVLEVL